MSIITVGTMAFDAIETPFGKVDKDHRGSATMWLMPPVILCLMSKQISIVGYDFPEEELNELRKGRIHRRCGGGSG